ncbi:putative integral ER membrane protein Scs2 [Talaromyces proteolyticus]|uniref:Integral ER membrane protein Scs2 n=1 Tax=Talaromyces proteolyticus TaxID=1131652 RepID=A0AAD4Q0G0_9EURO|nr:putative integral ER membrane protein Scs2 [Talaromyces proteolyticus]KAH8697231.1 putative integral ER membrane protein Scs2 [Talaromyces proteolyticus]
MSVDLEPSDLGFRRPFDREVAEVLRLRNPNGEPVAFKVKTTAPKHYCVRPNSGRIEPGKHVEVQVLLQAMKEDPPADAKCKDKFLVQSVAITGDLEFSNVTSIFEKAPKASVQERKIRVTFLPADATNGVAHAEEELPAYSSPAANFETPVPTASKSVSNTSPISQPNFDKTPKAETPAESPKEVDLSTSEDAKTTGTSIVATASGNVEQLLADARAEIRRLKDELSEGLRQRKTDRTSEGDKSAPLLQQQHPQAAAEAGVPVQIVAALCLLSFLLAYFFF